MYNVEFQPSFVLIFHDIQDRFSVCTEILIDSSVAQIAVPLCSYIFGFRDRLILNEVSEGDWLLKVS